MKAGSNLMFSLFMVGLLLVFTYGLYLLVFSIGLYQQTGCALVKNYTIYLEPNSVEIFLPCALH